MKIRISCCPLRTAKGRYHIDGREQHTGRATVDAKRHEQTKELAITLPSLEESDGCTMVHVYLHCVQSACHGHDFLASNISADRLIS